MRKINFRLVSIISSFVVSVGIVGNRIDIVHANDKDFQELIDKKQNILNSRNWKIVEQYKDIAAVDIQPSLKELLVSLSDHCFNDFRSYNDNLASSLSKALYQAADNFYYIPIDKPQKRKFGLTYSWSIYRNTKNIKNLLQNIPALLRSLHIYLDWERADSSQTKKCEVQSNSDLKKNADDMRIKHLSNIRNCLENFPPSISKYFWEALNDYGIKV